MDQVKPSNARSVRWTPLTGEIMKHTRSLSFLALALFAMGADAAAPAITTAVWLEPEQKLRDTAVLVPPNDPWQGVTCP